MPYYYPESVPNPSGSFDSGLLETPTETATSSEMASSTGVDDASDPGTAMNEADGALEDGNQLQCTQPQARALPREQHSSLRPTIFSRRWKDEEDEEEAEEGEEEDRDDKEAEVKLLKAVRKLSRPKQCEL